VWLRLNKWYYYWGQVRHHLLETAVFFLELFEAAYLAGAEATVELLPPVESLLGYPHLADGLLDRRARLHLAKREGDLLVCMT
jgi:hypothetical protein